MQPQPILAGIGALGVRRLSWAEARGSAIALRRSCFAHGAPVEDSLDSSSTHLLLAAPEGEMALGACRVFLVEGLGQARLAASAAAYRVETLLERHPALRLAELSRFCLSPAARGRPALEAMWRALWRLMRDEGVDAIFGCASLVGADFARHAATLGALCDPVRNDPSWCVPARDPVAALRPEPGLGRARLPPLLRGYAELGAAFSPEATLDATFDTADVFVVQPVEALNRRYVAFFS